MRIFIAGPYTMGDCSTNIRNAILAADKIRGLGHATFVPHLSHFEDLIVPHDYDYWCRHDRLWLGDCDAIFRLPGISRGADKEVECAINNGIKVVYDISDLEF